MSGAGLQRRQSLWRQLDAASRYAWPAAMLAFGLLVIGLPLGLPAQAGLRPAYAMACVYFWSLYRPSSLPAPVVALAGVLVDLLGMSPLGLWAVLLLVLQGGVLAGRRRLVPLSFTLNWLCFSGTAAALCALAWLLQSALTLGVLPAWPLAAEILTACGCYPALAGLFIRAHRGAAAAELA